VHLWGNVISTYRAACTAFFRDLQCDEIIEVELAGFADRDAPALRKALDRVFPLGRANAPRRFVGLRRPKKKPRFLRELRDQRRSKPPRKQTGVVKRAAGLSPTTLFRFRPQEGDK
jgi:hypothetical protein